VSGALALAAVLDYHPHVSVRRPMSALRLLRRRV